MSSRTDLKSLLERVRAEGGIVSKSRSGHWKIRNPFNGRSVNITSTPSNPRTIHNAVTRIKRIGFLTEKRGTGRTPRRESVLSR